MFKLDVTKIDKVVSTAVRAFEKIIAKLDKAIDQYNKLIQESDTKIDHHHKRIQEHEATKVSCQSQIESTMAVRSKIAEFVPSKKVS